MEERNSPRSKFRRMVKLFEYEILAFLFAMIVCAVFILNQAFRTDLAHEDSKDVDTSVTNDLDLRD